MSGSRVHRRLRAIDVIKFFGSRVPIEAGDIGMDLATGIPRGFIATRPTFLLPRYQNTLYVDDTYGDDSTATPDIPSRPFKTINTALAAASSGDTVLVNTGTYEVASPITMPAGVTLKGISANATVIQKTNVTADTTLLTMADNCRIEDFAIKLTSVQHHTLIGILFPGTSNAATGIRRIILDVNNSTAPAGSSDVIGVAIRATGLPNAITTQIRASTIRVTSTGNGTKRGILVDTSASNFSIRDVNVSCTGSGGGTFIGIETNIAGADFGIDSGNVLGTTADVAQTAGTIHFSGLDLVGGSTNGLSFTVDEQSAIFPWADPGGIPGNATRFLRPGTGASSATEIQLRISRKFVFHNLSIQAVIAPGAGKTDVFTVRRNGADTILTASLVGTATSVLNLTEGVFYAPSDRMSIKIVTAIATALSDVVVLVEGY